MSMFVCVKCREYPKACTAYPGGQRLPILCGPDRTGKMINCEWHEVPDDAKEFDGKDLPF